MRSPREFLRRAFGTVLVLGAGALGMLACAALADSISNTDEYRAPAARLGIAAVATLASLITINGGVQRLRGSKGVSVQLGEMSFALTLLLLFAWAFVTFASGPH